MPINPDVNVSDHLRTLAVPKDQLADHARRIHALGAKGIPIGQCLGWLAQYGPQLLSVLEQIITLLGAAKPTQPIPTPAPMPSAEPVSSREEFSHAEESEDIPR